MADAIKSLDGTKSLDQRTIWEIHTDGSLKEYGADSWAFTRNVLDVEILLELLLRNQALIHNQANKQRGRMYGGKIQNTYL